MKNDTPERLELPSISQITRSMSANIDHSLKSKGTLKIRRNNKKIQNVDKTKITCELCAKSYDEYSYKVGMISVTKLGSLCYNPLDYNLGEFG